MTPTSLPLPSPALLDDASLFLDFDGTLVEIAERHDGVVVDAALPALIPALAKRLGGRLALVSGRPADELLGYLALDPAAPGVAIAGSHGLERIAPDGAREQPGDAAAVTRAIAMLEDGVAALSGVVIERKPFGAAVHYRAAPEHASASDTLAGQVAARTGLELQRGKMVAELRLGGADKGSAVDHLMAIPPMPGTRPVFVGDDLTDEAGFRAAIALGGAGVLVGEREDSAATFALPDVAAVRDWLAAFADADAAR
jgi:trehalose 6-phosphate phosphatase